MFLFRTYTSLSAALGGVAAVFVRVWVRPTWEHVLLLLGPLVVVPLVLGVVGARAERSSVGTFWRAAVLLQLPAAFLLAGSLAVDPGPLAGTLATPWLVVTALSALLGITRLQRHRGARLEEAVLDGGLVFLAIGGGWTVLTRAGVHPLGFSPVIVLLTAVHFHFAGLALPAITALVGRAGVGSGPTAPVYRYAAGGVLAGVPLVAIGITLSPPLEWIASWILAASAACVALLQLAVASREPPLARLLLTLSSISLLAGMAFAAVYALGEFLEHAWLDIPTMIRWHGTTNAIGFAIAGLAGHTLARPGTPDSGTPSLPSRRIA